MAVTTPRFPRTYAELKEKVPNIGIVIVAILSWYFFHYQFLYIINGCLVHI